MASETPLIQLLEAIDADPRHDGIILSDGAYDWTIDNLIAAIQNAVVTDTAEYVQSSTSDGRLTIHRLDPQGFMRHVPTYTQKPRN